MAGVFGTWPTQQQPKAPWPRQQAGPVVPQITPGAPPPWEPWTGPWPGPGVMQQQTPRAAPANPYGAPAAAPKAPRAPANPYAAADAAPRAPAPVQGATLGLPPGMNPQNQAQPTTPQAGGLIPGPDWLNNPGDAVLRALRLAGYNAAAFNPFTRAVLNNADNLVAQLLSQSIGPQFSGGVADITNNDAMLQALANLIKQGGAGAGVLGGATAGDLGRINALYDQANAAQGGTMNPAINYVAQYLSDPGRAARLSSSLLYGGLTPTAQSAAQAPMAGLLDYYQQLLETRPEEARSLIGVLLGQYGGPAGRTPFWFYPQDWNLNQRRYLP